MSPYRSGETSLAPTAGTPMRRMGRWTCVVMAVAFLPLACTHAPRLESGNPAAPIVRVCLLNNQQQVKVTIQEPPMVRTDSEPQGRPLIMPAGSSVTVSLSPAGWSVGNVPVGTGEMIIQPKTTGSVSINDKAYRGTFHLIPGEKGFDGM